MRFSVLAGLPCATVSDSGRARAYIAGSLLHQPLRIRCVCSRVGSGRSPGSIHLRTATAGATPRAALHAAVRDASIHAAPHDAHATATEMDAAHFARSSAEWNLISVNNRATELQSVKCADSAGNSLVVSGVITYRVVDAARAVLDMGPRLDGYVHLQGQAILKKVCSQYKYITYDGSPSLITEQSHLGDMLRMQLQQTVDVCGVAVESFMLSDLAYAKVRCSVPAGGLRGCLTPGRRVLFLAGDRGADACAPAGAGHHRRAQDDCDGRGGHRVRRAGGAHGARQAHLRRRVGQVREQPGDGDLRREGPDAHDRGLGEGERLCGLKATLMGVYFTAAEHLRGVPLASAVQRRARRSGSDAYARIQRRWRRYAAARSGAARAALNGPQEQG